MSVEALVGQMQSVSPQCTFMQTLRYITSKTNKFYFTTLSSHSYLSCGNQCPAPHLDIKTRITVLLHNSCNALMKINAAFPLPFPL